MLKCPLKEKPRIFFEHGKLFLSVTRYWSGGRCWSSIFYRYFLIVATPLLSLPAIPGCGITAEVGKVSWVIQFFLFCLICFACTAFFLPCPLLGWRFHSSIPSAAFLLTFPGYSA